MELTLLQRAEEAERATAADEFRIISEAALAIFGWQDERYKHVLRLLEAGASLDAAMTLAPVALQVGVLLDAIDACQSDEDVWLRDLPRFVTAACLRARASEASSEG